MSFKISTMLFVLLFFCLIGQSLAQNRVPGVKGGDYFKYNITSYWSSEDPNTTVPNELQELNNTIEINFKVNGVSGANVTATDTYHYVNGSEHNFLIVQNVEFGESYYMNAFQSVIAADLNVNDLVHPAGNDSLKIDQTITRNYAGESRETNIVTINETIKDETNSTIGTQNIVYYFDKKTGMLVESIFQVEYTDTKETGSLITELTETNRWTVTTPITQVIATLTAITILTLSIILVYYRRKRHKKRAKR